MVSDNQYKTVYCVEHNIPMLIKSTDSNLFIGGTEVSFYERPTDEEIKHAKEQMDTMTAFSLGNNISAPSYLPKKNVRQAAIITKPNNTNLLPTMTETLIEFGGFGR